MAVKFSEFSPATIASNVEFIVGYTTTGNLNQQIPPANLNTTYSFTTITDPSNAANVDLVFTGAQPNVANTTESIQFTAGTAIALTAGTDEITITNNGVTSFTNSNGGSFVAYGTVNTDATGAVTIGDVDLTASGTASGTTFLRGDNQWATPTDTVNTYTLPITGGNTAVTATLTGSAGDTDPVLITAGNEISFSSISGGGFTIDSTASGTISGSGTAGKVPLWTGATALSDSVITQDSSNIGIGTSSPLSKLHISTGADSNLGNIEFVIGGTSGANARTGRIIKNTSSPYEMTIRASDFGSGSNLILNDTGGNVGIGTTSVASGGTNTQNVQIHNSTANSTYLKLSTAGTGAGAGDGLDLVLGNNGEAYLWNRENANTIFATNNTPRMTITDAGGISFGNSNTAYGASGQVLQSNGDLPPTWVAAPAGLPTKTVDTVTISGTSTNTLDVTSPTNPSGVEYIDVYINGVYQAKANATLSAKRLTLAAGFYPDGAIIETVTTT